jgi:hypothetical protein
MGALGKILKYLERLSTQHQLGITTSDGPSEGVDCEAIKPQ